jgi:hypothetical protein
MRLTFDLRIGNQPEHFLAFEIPLEEPLPRTENRVEMLRGIEELTAEELTDSLAEFGLSLQQVSARYGSVEVIVQLMEDTWPVVGPFVIPTAQYFGRQARDAAIQRAIGRCASRVWERFRTGADVLGTPRVARMPDGGPRSGVPSAGGDLLATARRVAANEASLIGCTAQLHDTPEIQASGYKAIFALTGDRCAGSQIAVTVDWDGRGYTVKRRPARQRYYGPIS